MASNAQIDANRQNPLRHGLTAKTLVLATEEREAFDRLRAALARHWEPMDEHENSLLDALAEAQWRLARVRRTETAFFDECIAAMVKDNPDLEPDQAMARVFIDPEYRKRMSLFLRYQTSIERAVRQAFRELAEAVDARLAIERKEAEALVDSPRRPDRTRDFVSQPSKNTNGSDAVTRTRAVIPCGEALNYRDLLDLNV